MGSVSRICLIFLNDLPDGKTTGKPDAMKVARPVWWEPVCSL